MRANSIISNWIGETYSWQTAMLNNVLLFFQVKMIYRLLIHSNLCEIAIDALERTTGRPRVAWDNGHQSDQENTQSSNSAPRPIVISAMVVWMDTYMSDSTITMGDRLNSPPPFYWGTRTMAWLHLISNTAVLQLVIKTLRVCSIAWNRTAIVRQSLTDSSRSIYVGSQA